MKKWEAKNWKYFFLFDNQNFLVSKFDLQFRSWANSANSFFFRRKVFLFENFFFRNKKDLQRNLKFLCGSLTKKAKKLFFLSFFLLRYEFFSSEEYFFLQVLLKCKSGCHLQNVWHIWKLSFTVWLASLIVILLDISHTNSDFFQICIPFVCPS